MSKSRKKSSRWIFEVYSRKTNKRSATYYDVDPVMRMISKKKDTFIVRIIHRDTGLNISYAKPEIEVPYFKRTMIGNRHE